MSNAEKQNIAARIVRGAAAEAIEWVEWRYCGQDAV
jgi:hypothetical protein